MLQVSIEGGEDREHLVDSPRSHSSIISRLATLESVSLSAAGRPKQKDSATLSAVQELVDNWLHIVNVELFLPSVEGFIVHRIELEKQRPCLMRLLTKLLHIVDLVEVFVQLLARVRVPLASNYVARRYSSREDRVVAALLEQFTRVTFSAHEVPRLAAGATPRLSHLRDVFTLETVGDSFAAG